MSVDANVRSSIIYRSGAPVATDASDPNTTEPSDVFITPESFQWGGAGGLTFIADGGATSTVTITVWVWDQNAGSGGKYIKWKSGLSVTTTDASAVVGLPPHTKVAIQVTATANGPTSISGFWTMF